MAAGRHRLLGYLPCVPHVGHPWATLLQRAVGLLPAPVPRLRVERVGLAPCRARRIAQVGGRRRIDEVANGGGVQDVGAVLEVDQVGQGHRRVCDDQLHLPVRAHAQHLVPRVAGGEPEGPCSRRIGPVPAPAQTHLLDDKLGERLGITFPLVHVGRGERDSVDVAAFVTTRDPCRWISMGGYWVNYGG